MPPTEIKIIEVPKPKRKRQRKEEPATVPTESPKKVTTPTQPPKESSPIPEAPVKPVEEPSNPALYDQLSEQIKLLQNELKIVKEAKEIKKRRKNVASKPKDVEQTGGSEYQNAGSIVGSNSNEILPEPPSEIDSPSIKKKRIVFETPATYNHKYSQYKPQPKPKSLSQAEMMYMAILGKK